MMSKWNQALQTKTVNLLKEFRGLNAGQFRAPNKMILPDSAQLLPLWTLGLVKVAALRGSARDVNADERIAVGFEMMASAVQQIAKLIYPNLYPVFDMSGAFNKIIALFFATGRTPNCASSLRVVRFVILIFSIQPSNKCLFFMH